MDIDNLVTAFEGALAEQFVFQELIACSEPFIEQKLHYWIREAKNSNAEIDCLYQIGNSIYPIEIKTGKRGKLKSMHVFLAEKKKDTGIRFNIDNPSVGKNSYFYSLQMNIIIIFCSLRMKTIHYLCPKE